MRRTKIVATLGPASEKPQLIRTLIEAGADVVRLNRSHGTRVWHERAFKSVREESARLGKPVAIMVDLAGPKMRIGRVADGGVLLEKGAQINIAAGADGVSDRKVLYVPYPEIVKDVKPGDRILLDDGNVTLKVISRARGAVRCRVAAGGWISDRKGLNLPGVALSVPSVTQKDLDDLAWAARMGADYVAVSFVRSGGDVTRVRSFLHKIASPIRVIAKIEKPEALARIDRIASLSDGVMVARGDLGVEMNLEEVPVAQQRIIQAAHAHDILVIVATQMLESMTGKPRPTRAEVSDVAAAIFGGTDAVMLSGETAVGQYPVEAVRQMASIAEAAEGHLERTGTFTPVFSASAVYAIADAVCHGAYSAARDLSAKAVFISTTSGRTALLFSKYRFPGVLVGASDDEKAVRRMALYWGVNPLQVPRCREHQRLLREIEKETLARGLVSRGDTVLFVGGSPLGKTGATNLLIVHHVPPARSSRRAASISGKTPHGRLMAERGRCILCGTCVGICPVAVYKIDHGKLQFNRGNLKKCLGDWECRDACPVGAVSVEPSGQVRSGK